MTEPSAGSVTDLSAVPLFPLPNLVMFPRAVLPLHIFEHRYRLMTADALAGSRLVAMALLRAGWEKDYHGRPAIEPVLCVGRILSAEQLSDGKYNFLLQGILRATVVEEFFDRPYRYARLAPLDEPRVLEIDLTDERQRLVELLSAPPLGAGEAGRQFRQMLSSTMPTADIADVLAFHVLEQVSLKQELLADGDVRRRVRRVVAALSAMQPLAAMLQADGRAGLN